MLPTCCQAGLGELFSAVCERPGQGHPGSLGTYPGQAGADPARCDQFVDFAGAGVSAYVLASCCPSPSCVNRVEAHGTTAPSPKLAPPEALSCWAATGARSSSPVTYPKSASR